MLCLKNDLHLNQYSTLRTSYSVLAENIFIYYMFLCNLTLLMAEVSGGRVRGRPRLGWMDGVKVALGNRGMTLRDNERKTGKRGEPWYICN